MACTILYLSLFCS